MSTEIKWGKSSEGEVGRLTRVTRKGSWRGDAISTECKQRAGCGEANGEGREGGEGRRESQQPRAFQSPGEEILGGQRVGTGSDLRWNWGSGALTPAGPHGGQGCPGGTVRDIGQGAWEWRVGR